MPRKRRHEEHVNLERWLVSYADFITLLFAFFVVMYAISSINEGKYRVLSDTMTAAFKTTPKTARPIQVGSDGVTGEPSPLQNDQTAAGQPSAIALVKRSGSGQPSALDLLQRTARDNALGEIADDFTEAFRPLIDQQLINITRDDLWVEIEINTSILYPSGSAELEDEALPVLARIAEILKRYPNHLQVEGFTDNLPINTPVFPSNWELSAARAASVVHLFMNNGVEPERMAAIGFGEYRPVADNVTPEGRRRNRRVVLVVLADDKARRALDINRTVQSGAAGG
jgi:chemotaxis protein MotB